MPNARLNSSKQALVLAALCEGTAINSVCRMSVKKPGIQYDDTAEPQEDDHELCPF